MHHSRSMPDFVEQGAGPEAMEGLRKSFDGDAKGFQTRMLAGDTRQAEMFVRDQLTTGFAPPSSPLADILPIQGAAKPQAKYDPNTGKFYRSVVVDPSCIPAALPATELMALFCSEELRYNPGTHTGVVLNMAYTLTVTCVGDTHVQADDMHAVVQQRISALVRDSFPSPAAANEVEADTCLGMTMFSSGAKGPEGECELVADSCAGISLFAPIAAPAKQIRAVKAVDTCCGMTMFTAEEEEDELSDTETASPRSAAGSMSSLKQFVADTCAGMTLFSNGNKQVALDELVADGVMGLTLYSPKEQQGGYDVHAETCNGFTTFTKCGAAPEADASEDAEECADMASSCVGGFTDFTPALRKMQQDPMTYTKEQQWLSDLAWGAAY